jgi:hypothetical protein
MAAKKKSARRTTMRSSKGTKLYAKRNAQGQFEDIQTYKRAHATDIKRVSKAETAGKASKKKVARKKAVK